MPFIENVTERVQVGAVDDEALPITRCVLRRQPRELVGDSLYL